ncbi:MAG TPA: metal-dependent hydrolase [Anaerolineae bacterium]
MKNIAHFATGLAAASFVPGVMEQAAQGSLLIALGGACAMLPDVLDFRLLRYLQQRDAAIAPDPAQPDPQPVAESIASQIRQAAQDGRPHVVQLYPARKSVAEWVCYTVIFDAAHAEVVVRMDEGGAEARVHTEPLLYSYANPLQVDELGGPTLAFHREQTEQASVRIDFLPWHRQWTHSLLMALGLGLIAGWLIAPLAGLVAALGCAMHVLVDAGGYLGVNLFAPLTHRRGQGLKLYHSADWIPNLVVVWASLTLLLLNMDHTRDLPLIAVGPYLAFVVFLPSAGLLALYLRRAWQQHVAQEDSQSQRDLQAETDEFGD